MKAWRQDRLDLAEVMLTKLGIGVKELAPSSTEQLADLFFEISGDQVRKSLYSEAIRWLEKAYDVLASQNLERLSSNSGELQLSITHGMVKVLMNIGDAGSITKAWSIIGEMEIESGDRLAVSLLKLDLYDIDQTSSSQEYCDVLRKMVRSIRLTDSNLKTILHQVHKLRRRNAEMAHSLLSTLISERLLEADEIAWLEKALITVVWNCTTSTDLNDALGLLKAIIEIVAANLSRPLSPSANHAAHIVRKLSIYTTEQRIGRIH